jgi:hypothetical protein
MDTTSRPIDRWRVGGGFNMGKSFNVGLMGILITDF